MSTEVQEVEGRKRSRSGSCSSDGEASKRKRLPSAGMEEEAKAEGEEDERVAILDAGAQYGKVIDRRVRELFVESVMLPLDTPASQLKTEGFCALIISGGPNSVNDINAPLYDPEIFDLGLPILGICYGHQLINKHFGGTVEAKDVREDGQFSITVDRTCSLFHELEESQDVLLTHGDSLGSIAECCRGVAQSGKLVAAIAHQDREIYGVQFHPEVDLTVNGTAMMRNFLYRVCGCRGTYTLGSREKACIQYIRKQVGDAKVLSLVSGGVDSTVCTALLNTALGPDRVVAVHIDNGFMRKNESEKVKESLEKLGLRLIVVTAAQIFFTSQTLVTYQTTDGQAVQRYTPMLLSATAPEEKRKIIGDTFVKVADAVLTDLGLEADAVFLAQGTLRPDLIESASLLASSRAHVIKTHHNDTELVRELRKKGRVIEPLCDFHKDEVRSLGLELGLPSEMVYRHPFPGPGLAIRVICQTDPCMRDDFGSIISLLAHIVGFHQALVEPSSMSELIQCQTSLEEQEFLSRATESGHLSATVLPILSVGVQGDARTHKFVAALSSDQEPCWPDLMQLAKIIPRICHDVNRVVWVFGGTVNGPITDVTPTHLTPGVLATLREADDVAHSVLHRHGAAARISQMPVVLIPIHFDRDPHQRPVTPSCQRSVVVRTFITSDFMTGIPATPGNHLPLEVLADMQQSLASVPGISRVLYDLTPKPPGTTEWE